MATVASTGFDLVYKYEIAQVASTNFGRYTCSVLFSSSTNLITSDVNNFEEIKYTTQPVGNTYTNGETISVSASLTLITGAKNLTITAKVSSQQSSTESVAIPATIEVTEVSFFFILFIMIIFRVVSFERMIQLYKVTPGAQLFWKKKYDKIHFFLCFIFPFHSLFKAFESFDDRNFMLHIFQFLVEATWTATATYDTSGTYAMVVTYDIYGDLTSNNITIAVVGEQLYKFITVILVMII